MKFPGDNEIHLTDGAILELLKSQAPSLFGDPAARITKIVTKSWPAGLVVTYTTDPDPDPDPSDEVPEPAPRPLRSSILRHSPPPETPPNATATAPPEDDDPF